MINPLIMAQISDIHISEGPEDYQGIPVRENFLNTLENVGSHNPDLVVLSGDLAADHGEIGAYKFLAEALAKISIPTVIMPGNHDILSHLKNSLNLEPDPDRNEYYFIKSFQGFPIIFLDTTSNKLSRSQLEWLKDTSKEQAEKELLVFIHHPPLKCGCLFMDTHYPLLNWEETWDLISKLENIKHIFCGHYHTDKIIHSEGKNIYLCPSTMMQLSNSNPDFEIISKAPAWRMIKWDGRELETKIYSL